MNRFFILIDDVEFNKSGYMENLSDISGIDISKFKGIFNTITEKFNWDNSIVDMKLFSKLYPKRVITLQYFGDTVSDTYREYYLDGKVQVVPVRLIFDEFNPDYLA